MQEPSAIINRCCLYTFKTSDELFECKKKFHPLLWLKIFENDLAGLTKQLFISLNLHRNLKSVCFSSITIGVFTLG
jgi:hypothetical protein